MPHIHNFVFSLVVGASASRSSSSLILCTHSFEPSFASFAICNGQCIDLLRWRSRVLYYDFNSHNVYHCKGSPSHLASSYATGASHSVLLVEKFTQARPMPMKSSVLPTPFLHTFYDDRFGAKRTIPINMWTLTFITVFIVMYWQFTRGLQATTWYSKFDSLTSLC